MSEYATAINVANSSKNVQNAHLRNTTRRKNSSPLTNFPQIKKICILNSDIKIKDKREEKIIKVGSTNPRSVLKNNLVFSLPVKKENSKEEEEPPLWMKRVQ